MTTHILLRLRGNSVEPIGCPLGTGIVFAPSEGMLRRCGKLMLVASAEVVAGASIGVRLVPVSGSDQPQPVAVPSSGQPERELVLVQEYSPGCGAKRWPSFSVTFGPEVRVLRQDQTGGGSGSENWTLVSAPLGWAANIAGQFRNERDAESQTIGYRPGWVAPVVRSESSASVGVSRPTPMPAVNLQAGAWGALDGLKL